MMQKSFQKLYEETIEGLVSTPTLLLHVCCAPCSSSVLEELTKYFHVTVFYYNPNIDPADEYEKRVQEVKRFIGEMEFPHPVSFLEGPYEPEKFYGCAEGLEDAPEGGKRCEKCFRLRLRKTAEVAREKRFDFFTTTLTVSPLKNADLLNAIGLQAAEEYGVSFLPSDFKKKDGYLRSLVLSREYHLYRQDFCGCTFSRKASEKRKRDMIIDKIPKEYERAFAVVDLSAISHNVDILQAKVRPATSLLAVLKADGYGHGAMEIAALLSDRISFIGVATVDEALELRKKVSTKILILGYTFPNRYEELIREDIRPTLFSLEDAKEFSRVAASLQKTGYYHIAIDSGMNRLGLKPNAKSLETVRSMCSLPYIVPEGIFTHFATMDQADHHRADEQARVFQEFLASCRAASISFPYVHLSNSAAILREGDFSYNLVRMGIALYGIYPSTEMVPAEPLQPALSLYSRVFMVKEVGPEEAIGYGAQYITSRPMRIATVGFGYADGLPRSYAERGEVLIRGKRAKILGRICMDQFMCDVTDIESVQTGDLVTVVGTDGEDSIRLLDISERSERFPYEFLTNISKRVPRVFVKNGKIVAARDWFDEKRNSRDFPDFT